MQRIMLALAACGLLSACSSAPQKVDAAASTPNATATKQTAAAETEAERLDRIAKTLAGQSLYFDYDNYAIKSEGQQTLKQDFDLLKSAPQVSLRIEGNADERGSSEYNLALGQKRAEATRRALVLLGVPEAQLEATSYGKERPRANCHEEKCWAENRRVDFATKKANGG